MKVDPVSILHHLDARAATDRRIPSECSFFQHVTKIFNKLTISFFTFKNFSKLKAKLREVNILSILDLDDF